MTTSGRGSDHRSVDSQDFDAVVYDLDGTLVRLDVDWAEAERDVASALAARGIDTDEHDQWDLLDVAEERGYRALFEEKLSPHEREGARRSTRLDCADRLPHDVPVGVCSLNCEAACHVALELHGLDSAVDVVAGRDSLPAYKPDPNALLGVVDALDVDPAATVFVGDSKSDRTTAERAGVVFAWAHEWHSG